MAHATRGTSDATKKVNRPAVPDDRRGAARPEAGEARKPEEAEVDRRPPARVEGPESRGIIARGRVSADVATPSDDGGARGSKGRGRRSMDDRTQGSKAYRGRVQTPGATIVASATPCGAAHFQSILISSKRVSVGMQSVRHSPGTAECVWRGWWRPTLGRSGNSE